MSLNSDFDVLGHPEQIAHAEAPGIEMISPARLDLYLKKTIGCCILDCSGIIQEVTLDIAFLLNENVNHLTGQALVNLISPEDQAIFSIALNEIMQARTTQKCILRLKKASPPNSWFQLVLSPLASKDPSLFRYACQLLEVSKPRNQESAIPCMERAHCQELHRLNRILTAQNRSSKLMRYATDEKQYLHDVCHIVVDACKNTMVWIGYALQDEKKSIIPVAYAGFEKSYLDTLSLTWADTERGQGPTGTAIRTGKPQRCRNMLTDPAFHYWREEAQKRGYASSIAIPISLKDTVLGALSLYSGEPDTFSDDEIALLVEMADDLAFGINALHLRSAHLQAETAVRQSEENFRCLVEMSPDALLVLKNNKIILTNTAAVHLFGAVTLEQILSLSIVDLFYPSFFPAMREEIEKLVTAELSTFVETRIIRFDGSERFVEAGSACFERAEERFIQIVLRDITERKEIEQENEWLASYPELNPNPITEVDMDANSITYLNHAAREAFPTLEQQGFHHPWFTILEHITTQMRLDGLTTIWREVQIGPTCYRQSISIPFGDHRLRLHGIDITERKQAEEALLKSQEETIEGKRILDALMEYAPIGITIIDAPSLRIRMMSQYSKKMFGNQHELAKFDEFIQHFPVYHKDYVTPMTIGDLPLARAIFSGDTVRNMELVQLNANGRWVVLLCNAAPIRNATGDIIGGISTWQDITELSQVQTALRKSEADLHEYTQSLEQRVLARTEELHQYSQYTRSLLEASLDPMVAVSLAGTITDVNGATEIATGIAREALIGTDFSDYFTESDKARDIFQQVLANGQITNFPLSIRHVTGSTLHVLYNATVYLNAAGEKQGVFAAARDITERLQAQEEAKKRQQQLLQADKMVSLGILVSGVAHEINNPNHSIMTNAAVLSEIWKDVQPILNRFEKDYGDFVLGGYEYSEHRDHFAGMFGNIITNSRRIQVIVNELRDFARYNPSEHMADIDINAIVQSSVILVSNLIRKATDQFFVAIPADLPPVHANRQRIEQVLINLIQNACQALPSRDRGITINARHIPAMSTIQIVVQDEGIGIPQENKTHLGDPFFTTKRTMGGMGLGLWVCFNIVHEHGGTLTFEPNGEQGTRAILTLPVSPPKKTTETPTPDKESLTL